MISVTYVGEAEYIHIYIIHVYFVSVIVSNYTREVSASVCLFVSISQITQEIFDILEG